MKDKTCSCCEGLDIITPILIANRPGLSALAYRVGTHSTFLETMLARLSDHSLEIDYFDKRGEQQWHSLRPLQGLTTRNSIDPAIAFLDGWANVADVLTFYQERIANEGFLRTATERFSIQELARLVGYKLRPGVSSSVFLAFELEKDTEAEIPAGTRAQSIPGPGELPQTFETSESLKAHSDLNNLRPRMKRPQYILPMSNIGIYDARRIKTIYIEGTSTNLKLNSALLFTFVGTQVLRFVKAIEIQYDMNRTRVDLQPIPEELLVLTRDVQVQTMDRLSQLEDETRRNAELIGIAHDGVMAKRVMEGIKSLRRHIEKSQTIDEAATHIKAASRKIETEYKEAADHDFRRLKEWTKKASTELKEVQLNLIARKYSVASRRSRMAIFPPRFNTSIPKIKPPKRPVTYPAIFRPRYKNIYRKKSDVHINLAARYWGIPRKKINKAWEQVTSSYKTSFNSFESFQVKAAPFGHNAPPQPVYNTNGAIIGRDEWVLAELGFKFNVRLYSLDTDLESQVYNLFKKVYSLNDGESNNEDFPPIGLEISINDDTIVEKCQTSLQELTCVESKEKQCSLEHLFSLQKIKVNIVVTYSKGNGQNEWMLKTVSLAFNEPSDSTELPESTIEIAASEEKFSIYIDNDIPRNLEKGTQKQYRVGRREVNIMFNEELRIAHLLPTYETELQRRSITLDAEYDQIIPGSWIIIIRSDRANPVIGRVEKVQTISRQDYGISARITHLVMEEGSEWLFPEDNSISVLRGATVYAQSKSLTPADEPITTDIGHVEESSDTIARQLSQNAIENIAAAIPMQMKEDEEALDHAKKIELDGIYSGFEPGQWVIVSGETTSGILESEPTRITNVTVDIHKITINENNIGKLDLPGDTPHTTIHFEEGLANTYKRDTVNIYGNIVKATHGETRKEVLGSGDGTKELQAFRLKQAPLTYLSAPTPAGAESTLEVRVNDILWHEADNLFTQGPSDWSFITRTDEDNNTSVVFGNGENGSRLPTDVENIKSVFRFGIGKAGNVDEKKISLLATKPLGVKSVINPRPATGGADPEATDQARRNAPLSIMALDRLVSVKDYADFTRSYAGIAKTSAARLSDGHQNVIHISIAGIDDIPIDKNSELYRNLNQSLHKYGDPLQHIMVTNCEHMMLIISAEIRLLPDYLWEAVEPMIRERMLDAFGFDKAELGKDILRSEVISTIQSINGVANVDLEKLYSWQGKIDNNDGDEPPEPIDSNDLRERITVEMDRIDEEGNIKPAEIAYLTPDIPETLILNELLT